ncbi:CDP-alcohol phosphatidyltransferase family protein [Actinacidiphila sp. bgisy167]|uniref:CDP-alcohol phosphatidyltransferase family protein n=1 Tax=Actinacidiphila sp. bgisy167 TaxID=3413797 RepID=UPI003D7325CA
METPPLAEVRRLTEKKRDAWWTVFLVDPVATPLVRWTARWTRVTPNQITWGALLLGLGAAACFATADWKWLVVGAALYHLSFILDCMDGKLARLTGRGSEFGGWLDYIFDRVRVVCCAAALMGGQFYRTDRPAYMWLALAVIFLDALRYLDALQIFKVRAGMRKKIRKRLQQLDAARPTAFMEDLLRERADEDETQADIDAQAAAGVSGAEAPGPRTVPAQRTGEDTSPAGLTAPSGGTTGTTGSHAAAGAAHTADAPGAAEAAGIPLPCAEEAPQRVIDLQQTFKERFGPYERFRDFLIKHRVRPHLISGIEFQMAVFIVAPLTGAIVGVTIGAGVLLLVFEIAIIYKLLLSTRDFEDVMAQLDAEVRAQERTETAGDAAEGDECARDTSVAVPLRTSAN